MTDVNKGANITLYWLEQSRSQRIVWLFEELGLTYNLKTFKRTSEMLAPPELKKIHPLGKSPVITIETEQSEKPLVLAESGNITEYLCDHFGGEKLIPKRYPEGKEGAVGGETEEWMRYRYFMHYAEGTLMPFLVFQLVMDREFTFLSSLWLGVCGSWLMVWLRYEGCPCSVLHQAHPEVCCVKG